MASYDPKQALALAKSMRSTKFDAPKMTEKNWRLELPYSAYAELDNPNHPAPALPERKDFNTLGKKVTIGVNQFKVTQWPDDTIVQFDVRVTHASGEVNREHDTHVDETAANTGLVRALWNSKPVKSYLKTYNSLWIFDDSRIAWNKKEMPKNKYGMREFTIKVDLDREKGKVIKPEHEGRNTWNVTIKQTTTVKMSAIRGFLDKKMKFSNEVFEAINFLDHVLRQTPLEKYVQVKRSFYAWTEKTDFHADKIDSCINFMRGVYASMRLCHSTGPGTGLAVNIDVANGLFWKPIAMKAMIENWFSESAKVPGSRFDTQTLIRMFKPVKDKNGQLELSNAFNELKKFAKLKIHVTHKNWVKGANGKYLPDFHEDHVVKRFHFDVKHFALGGANAKNTTFMWKRMAPNKKDDREISVYQYMDEKYNLNIEEWGLPLVETFKGGSFPWEHCEFLPNQRFPFKTSPRQTQAMIKAAVKRPDARIDHIRHGLEMLKWDEDRYLKEFGLKIDGSMTQSKAVVLPNPEIMFGGKKKLNPRTSGRWNIAGCKFLKPNSAPLNSWGVALLAGEKQADEATALNFVKKFVESYVNHGGIVPSKSPALLKQGAEDIPTMIEKLRKTTMNKFKAYPQIMMLILPNSDSQVYNRIKKNLECRWGIPSQCVRAEKVKNFNDGYLSNVCMKFNAKLGGTTNMVAGKEKDGSKNFFGKKRTMIIGADVTHPAHGSKQASMAALSMSADKGAQRYWANCQTNGFRAEMISPANIEELFRNMFPHWIATVGDGQGPEHIYYFRDGVSEGQYAHVLDQEVKAMKKAIAHHYDGIKNDGLIIKAHFTVIVCSKRHKIRFFPNKGDFVAGDKNRNPVPGVLVERDVTHPFENDFYLCSHSAIQGTARPTHYHVILDEAKVATNQLHDMIYSHCYQYMRSTTPVSLYPAVYYAHLAAARCRAHEQAPGAGPPRFGQKHEEYKQDKHLADEKAKLLRIPAKRFEDMTEFEKIEHDEALEEEQIREAAPLLAMGSGVKDDNGYAGWALRHSMWYI